MMGKHLGTNYDDKARNDEWQMIGVDGAVRVTMIDRRTNGWIDR